MKEKREITSDTKVLIKKEKRRRSQVYNTIEYYNNMPSFAYFYSQDLINILSCSQIWSNLLLDHSRQNKAQVNSEDILHSFILCDSDLEQLLGEYGLNKELIFRTINIPSNKGSNTLPFSRLISNISARIPKIPDKVYKYLGIEKTIKETLPKLNISFDPELIPIFEKSIIDARYRFKTPVITPEIFLVSLMEKKCKASDIIRSFINNEKDWYLFRYKLFQRIHFEESEIMKRVPKSQRYFAYLLKSRLSHLYLSRLIELNLLKEGVHCFRTKLVEEALEKDLFLKIKKDILYSLSVSKRNYST